MFYILRFVQYIYKPKNVIIFFTYRNISLIKKYQHTNNKKKKSKKNKKLIK